MARPAGLDFLVNKSNWKHHRFDDAPVPDLAEGQVLFRVDRFALTANNISYALAGDSLGYWRFSKVPHGRENAMTTEELESYGERLLSLQAR